MAFKDKTREREYQRAWHRVNTHGTRAANANRRAKELGIAGRLISADVRAVISDAVCIYCGTAGNPSGTRAERLTIDHIVPMSKGGANSRENLQVACGRCNARKFSGTRPGWSSRYDACIDCGTTDRSYGGHGMCTLCYARSRYVPVAKQVTA